MGSHLSGQLSDPGRDRALPSYGQALHTTRGHGCCLGCTGSYWQPGYVPAGASPQGTSFQNKYGFCNGNRQRKVHQSPWVWAHAWPTKAHGSGPTHGPPKLLLSRLSVQTDSTRPKKIFTSQSLPSKQPFTLWETVSVFMKCYPSPRSLGAWPNGEQNDFLSLLLCRHWLFILLPT